MEAQRARPVRPGWETQAQVGRALRAGLGGFDIPLQTNALCIWGLPLVACQSLFSLEDPGMGVGMPAGGCGTPPPETQQATLPSPESLVLQPALFQAGSPDLSLSVWSLLARDAGRGAPCFCHPGRIKQLPASVPLLMWAPTAEAPTLPSVSSRCTNSSVRRKHGARAIQNAVIGHLFSLHHTV